MDITVNASLKDAVKSIFRLGDRQVIAIYSVKGTQYTLSVEGNQAEGKLIASASNILEWRDKGADTFPLHEGFTTDYVEDYLADYVCGEILKDLAGKEEFEVTAQVTLSATYRVNLPIQQMYDVFNTLDDIVIDPRYLELNEDYDPNNVDIVLTIPEAEL